jgi:hypothetical protein
MLNDTVNPPLQPEPTVNPSTTAIIMAFAADTILQFALLVTWKCMSDTPFSQKNLLLARFLTSQKLFETIASTASLVVCPGLFEVLQATTPPSIKFSKSLPTPTDLSSIWGIYVIVMEKPSSRPRLYIGSATSALQGIRQRFQQYDLGLLLSQYVEGALEEDYTITHKGLLCWISKPAAALIPATRLLFIALETTSTYIFWAIKTTAGTRGMIHICLWDRDTLENDGVRSHCSINEGIHGDFDLTAEQLEAKPLRRSRNALK